MRNPVLFVLALNFIALNQFSFAAEPFPELYNSEKTPGAPDAPEEALKKLKMPDGFTATLFAHEPDVQNPIGMAWDTRGRMWIAENYTYAETSKRFELKLRDRVTILEDTDHDGKLSKDEFLGKSAKAKHAAKSDKAPASGKEEHPAMTAPAAGEPAPTGEQTGQ